MAMEKESADNEALKNNLLELENKRQEADMAKKQEELERRAEEEKRKLAKGVPATSRRPTDKSKSNEPKINR